MFGKGPRVVPGTACRVQSPPPAWLLVHCLPVFISPSTVSRSFISLSIISRSFVSLSIVSQSFISLPIISLFAVSWSFVSLSTIYLPVHHLLVHCLTVHRLPSVISRSIASRPSPPVLRLPVHHLSARHRLLAAHPCREGRAKIPEGDPRPAGVPTGRPPSPAPAGQGCGAAPPLGVKHPPKSLEPSGGSPQPPRGSRGAAARTPPSRRGGRDPAARGRRRGGAGRWGPPPGTAPPPGAAAAPGRGGGGGGGGSAGRQRRRDDALPPHQHADPHGSRPHHGGRRAFGSQPDELPGGHEEEHAGEPLLGVLCERCTTDSPEQAGELWLPGGEHDRRRPDIGVVPPQGIAWKTSAFHLDKILLGIISHRTDSKLFPLIPFCPRLQAWGEECRGKT